MYEVYYTVHFFFNLKTLLSIIYFFNKIENVYHKNKNPIELKIVLYGMFVFHQQLIYFNASFKSLFAHHYS